MEPFTLKLLILIGIVVGSFGLGWLIARSLRLRDVSGKIGAILFTLGLGLSPFIDTMVVQHKPWYGALKFGIDLAGGTNLVYQLEKAPTDGGMMDRLVGALRRRIDPAGTQELTIRQVGADRVEMIIPRATAEDIATIKRKVDRVGSLEFQILANDRDHKERIRQAQSVQRDIRDNNGRLVAGWRPIAPLYETVDGKRVEKPNPEFRQSGGIAVRPTRERPEFDEVLVIFDANPDRWVTGRLLQRAAPTTDESGRPAVSFVFNMKGASLFSSLTGNNKPLKDGFQRRLAILLDEKVHSAPSIRTTIGAHGIIEGIGTMQEVNELVEVLNAGALEVPLKKNPISEFTVSPTLGIDVQQRGITALIAATLAVFVFMAIYYLAIGLIADFCLMLNLILLVGIMSLIDATFTLPGLAGVVLTMGMAVDANVLIYERMREELSRGSSQRMAIHNGYDKAFSSIFDSNITTLLTAVILYMIGSDQVKGFAVTLFIGIALSMYTALYVSRVILEIVERKRWLKEFKMMTMIGETHMDFVKTQVPCAIASLVLIGAGLGAFLVRGETNYDIDFTGGTMVSMVFKDQQNSDDVRNKLTEAFHSDITLEQLTVAGGADEGRRFRLRTTEQDEAKVRNVVNDAFPDQIERVTMTYGELAAVAAATPAAATAEKPADQPAEPVASAGHQVELTFSRPVPPETMKGNFMEALATLKGPDGSPKYGELETTKSLFTLEPKEAIAAGAVDRADRMVLRTTDKVLAEADLKSALAVMQTTMANSPNFEEVNNFASSVAKEAKESAVIAIIASMIMIVAYIWFRFQNIWFGLAAVVALIHDVLSVLGMLAIGAYLNKTPLGPLLLLSDFKINLTMIAAFLTIVGYSLNDTIIIFDRLREIRGKNPAFTREMLNLAVNQTLSRTLLTAGTTFIVVFILYILGGEGIHGFAYAMLLGVILGTYSTIYIASPFVLYLMNRPKKAPGRPALAVSATRN